MTTISRGQLAAVERWRSQHAPGRRPHAPRACSLRSPGAGSATSGEPRRGSGRASWRHGCASCTPWRRSCRWGPLGPGVRRPGGQQRDSKPALSRHVLKCALAHACVHNQPAPLATATLPLPPCHPPGPLPPFASPPCRPSSAPLRSTSGGARPRRCSAPTRRWRG